MAEQQFRVILVTAPDAKTAEGLAEGLVEARLAACVNVVPGAASYYRWEGKLHKEPELLLLIKTRSGLMPDVIGFVKSKHPAKVPEIISLPIMEGEKNYLEFLAANTLFRPASERTLPL
jgi:periplasmic divalent cation tolerance protein